jgi:hypothetical protein
MKTVGVFSRAQVRNKNQFQTEKDYNKNTQNTFYNSLQSKHYNPTAQQIDSGSQSAELATLPEEYKKEKVKQYVKAFTNEVEVNPYKGGVKNYYVPRDPMEILQKMNYAKSKLGLSFETIKQKYINLYDILLNILETCGGDSDKFKRKIKKDNIDFLEDKYMDLRETK